MKARGRWLLVGVGVSCLLAVLAWAVTRSAPSSQTSAQVNSSGPSEPSPRPPPRPEPDAAPSPPEGLQLGARSEVGRQSTAQAIYRTALRELQRMDTVDESRARDAYLRGRAALERVEDELDQDDEPGHVQLRADIDALDTQMRRLYDEPEPS